MFAVCHICSYHGSMIAVWKAEGRGFSEYIRIHDLTEVMGRESGRWGMKEKGAIAGIDSHC
jgi:hypothetical protein